MSIAETMFGIAAVAVAAILIVSVVAYEVSHRNDNRGGED